MEKRAKLIRRLLGASAVAALTVVGLVGTAQAQTPDATATFVAQAEAAGLTDAQATAMQAQVNSYLAELGGRQVAANMIDLDGTGFLAVPVPGEPKVRNLAKSTTTGPEITPGCGLGDFCVFQKFGGNGGLLAKFKCNSPVNIPGTWLSGKQGSYWNHQTGGAHGFFYSGLNATGRVNLSAPVGSIVDRVFGVTPVDKSFEACH